MGLEEKRPDSSDSEYRIKGKLIDAISKSFQALVKYGVFLGLGYFGFRSVKEIAGQITVADIKAIIEIVWSEKAGDSAPQSLFQHLSYWLIGTILPWLLGIAGFIYGRNQKKLRGQTFDRLQGRIKDLELRIDPNRSTSGLDGGEETNDADR